MYVECHVDIYDMIDINLFSVIALNMMVLQLGYTNEFEPLFYNYLRPLTSLDEGLYALACEEDVRCVATLVRSFKSEKMLLLTWHDSSELTKELVFDCVTPRSFPQHDSSTPCKNSVCESVTPRCMPHCMLTPHTDEFVITYTQLSSVQRIDTQDHVLPTIQSQLSNINLSFVSQQASPSQVIEDVMRQLSFEETELDGESGFGDVERSVIESSRLSHDESFGVEDLDLNLNEPLDLNVSQIKTQAQLPVFEEPDIGRTQEPIVEGLDTVYKSQYDVQSSEEAGTNDDDDDFLVDEENEIVEPDVDVHLFGISMYVPFDNIGVTNLVLDDDLEGEDVDVINADGFDSDPANDDEISNYRRKRQKFTTAKEAKDRVYLHFIKSKRNLKLYKNDSVRVRTRCDGKVLVFTMSQELDQLAQIMEWKLGLVDQVPQSTNPNTTVKIVVERNTNPSLPTRVFQRIYICLGALKLGFRACKRDMLGLDSAIIKGPFSGQVLAAIGFDSNNRIYPFSYALVEAESGNNAEATGSASRQAQQEEPIAGQNGLGGSGVGAVIGLFVADCAGGAGGACGAGVGVEVKVKRKVQTKRISLQNITPTQPASQPSTNSQLPVTETRNVYGR
ncbi:hypothetical protein Tco_0093557 [Tanacetum coccineum]